MLATVRPVIGRNELILWMRLPRLGRVSLPVSPAPGAHAGVWRKGKLARLVPASRLLRELRLSLAPGD